MSATAGIRMKTPAHPGGFVKHEIIEPHNLSVTGTAHFLGITRPALSALLEERASLSPEMALRHRTGLRRLDGHPHAPAEQLQHRPGTQSGRRDRRGAVYRRPTTEFGLSGAVAVNEVRCRSHPFVPSAYRENVTLWGLVYALGGVPRRIATGCDVKFCR